jgi:hypothetical protein
VLRFQVTYKYHFVRNSHRILKHLVCVELSFNSAYIEYRLTSSLKTEMRFSSASLAALSLLLSSAASAPTTNDSQNTTSVDDVSHMAPVKRAMPLLYIFSNDNPNQPCTRTTGYTTVTYSKPGCYKFGEFKSWSPTNNPGCTVTVYEGGLQGNGGCNDMDIFKKSSNADGSCKRNTFTYRADGSEGTFYARWIKIHDNCR